MSQPTENAPPGKEVEYEVWPRDEPSKKVIVRARTWYFAVQLGAIHWQKHPHELEACIKNG